MFMFLKFYLEIGVGVRFLLKVCLGGGVRKFFYEGLFVVTEENFYNFF